MSEPSPPPFVVFRTPQLAGMDAYDRALQLVGVVHEIVGKAAARFYLKDRLDRAATALVFELGRARGVVSGRWRNYRAASDRAADIATILDILVAQQAAPEDELDRARALARDLIAVLAPRCNG